MSKNEDIFIYDVFFNPKGECRYRLLWRSNGEVAEDYQGWGTKNPDNLVSRGCEIIRELRRNFCETNRNILSGCKSSKDVENRLRENSITLPLGLTALKVLREINGTNKQLREKYYNSTFQSYIDKQGRLVEITRENGCVVGYSIDGNDIY